MKRRLYPLGLNEVEFIVPKRDSKLSGGYIIIESNRTFVLLLRKQKKVRRSKKYKSRDHETVLINQIQKSRIYFLNRMMNDQCFCQGSTDKRKLKKITIRFSVQDLGTWKIPQFFFFQGFTSKGRAFQVCLVLLITIKNYAVHWSIVL